MAMGWANRVAAAGVLVLAGAYAAAAQTVEIVYTPAVMPQALALKSSLRAGHVEAFSALGLVGASADRKREYAEKVATATVVIVVGEDAMKAASDVEFTCPVVLVGTGGKTAAKNRIIRVFAPTSPNAPSAKSVTSPAGAILEVSKGGREVWLAGDIWPTVEALVGWFK